MRLRLGYGEKEIRKTTVLEREVGSQIAVRFWADLSSGQKL
jgi:hypothetical protein